MSGYRKNDISDRYRGQVNDGQLTSNSPAIPDRPFTTPSLPFAKLMPRTVNSNCSMVAALQTLAVSGGFGVVGAGGGGQDKRPCPNSRKLLMRLGFFGAYRSMLCMHGAFSKQFHRATMHTHAFGTLTCPLRCLSVHDFALKYRPNSAIHAHTSTGMHRKT